MVLIDLFDDDSPTDDCEARLIDVVDPLMRLIYRHDLGDDREHELKIERAVALSPT